jgi:hypothetical protein
MSIQIIKQAEELPSLNDKKNIDDISFVVTIVSFESTNEQHGSCFYMISMLITCLMK